MVRNSVVESLEMTLKNLQRKMWLARTSKAFANKTNGATLDDLAGQIIAIQMSIQHFSK